MTLYAPYRLSDKFVNFLQYFNKAEELIAPNGYILLVDFEPPEGLGSTSDIIPNIIEKLKDYPEAELTVFKNGQDQSRIAVAFKYNKEGKPSLTPPAVEKGSAGSAITEEDKGGIDLRGLPIVTQPLSTPGLGVAPGLGVSSPLSRTVPVAQLSEEWRQIEQMLAAGIIPSTERIKEACCQQENLDIDKVLACIAGILRLEEERVSSTEPALKEFLVLLESDKTVGELQVALSKITVPAKEPQLLVR